MQIEPKMLNVFVTSTWSVLMSKMSAEISGSLFQTFDFIVDITAKLSVIGSFDLKANYVAVKLNKIKKTSQVS